MSRDSASLLGWMAILAAGVTVAAQQPFDSAQGRPTFRSGVDLVTVDAAVHDADGRPVSSLRAEDFRLEVDGRPRAITTAQFVSLETSETSHASAAAAIHFSSNEGADVGRTIVIAVDEAHIRRLEGRHALVSATRFIEALPPADRVAVVGLTSADRFTLTRDRVALRRHLESLTGIGDPMAQQLNLGVSEALEIAEGSRARLADAVLRECGRALTEYVNTARAADDAGGGRDACPEQVEQESRAMAQYAHMQAGMSIASLRALIARLKDLPGPKTIVLISEGMIVDPRRIDLSELAAQAQAARVTIYGLQLEIPTFEAAQDRVSPTAQRDLQVRHDGVSRVVGAARGAVFRQVGTDPKPFERIARELTGYYLLAFEARDGDRDGRPHRIRVSLARRGGELRARTGFTLPAPNPAARGAELTALLRSLQPVTELPLRVATLCVRRTLDQQGARGDQRRSGQPRHAVRHLAGVCARGWCRRDCRHRHAPGARRPLFLQRRGARRHLHVARRGHRSVRAAGQRRAHVQGPTGGRGRTASRRFDAGRAAGIRRTIRWSRSSIASRAASWWPTSRCTGVERAPRPDAVRVHIAASASGDPLVSAAATTTSVRDGGWSMARATLPIAALPPGSYVARAEIVSRGAVVGRTTRPFTIASR